MGFSVRKRGRETTATTTSDVGSCCCYRRFIRTLARPINESAPQRLSRRLSACPPEAEAIRFRRFPNNGARGVSQRSAWRIAGVYPQRARNSVRSFPPSSLSSLSLSFLLFISLYLPFSLLFPLSPALPFFLSLFLSNDTLTNRITSKRNRTGLITLAVSECIGHRISF